MHRFTFSNSLSGCWMFGIQIMAWIPNLKLDKIVWKPGHFSGIQGLSFGRFKKWLTFHSFPKALYLSSPVTILWCDWGKKDLPFNYVLGILNIGFQIFPDFGCPDFNCILQIYFLNGSHAMTLLFGPDQFFNVLTKHMTSCEFRNLWTKFRDLPFESVLPCLQVLWQYLKKNNYH